MFELIYTSTPQGLITGRSGFTTVALTEGFPPNLIAPIENMSGYKTLFPPGHEYEQHNPVNYSCQHYRFGNTLYIVLSRISYAGLSYTGRSNVLAHHLLFTKEELAQIPGGAVSVLSCAENFTPWSGKPGMLPQKSLKQIRYADISGRQTTWKELAGDQNWAQYIAGSFRQHKDETKCLAFDPLKIKAEEILALISETTAYLNREELYDFTFSTYSYSSGIANPLFLRAYVNDSLQLNSIRRMNPDSIIELGGTREQTAPLIPILSPDPYQTTEEDEEEEELLLPGIPREEPQNTPDSFPGIRDPEEAVPAVAEEITGEAQDNNSMSSPETYVEEDTSDNKRRNHIFILILIVLTLLLCGAVVYRIISGNNPPPAKAPAVAPSSSPASGEIRKDKTLFSEDEIRFFSSRKTAEPKKKSKTAPPREEGIEDFFSTPPPAKKKGIEKGEVSRKRKNAASLPSSAVPLRKDAGIIPFGHLSDQETFELYKNFMSSYSFILPRPLHNASGMEIKLRSVGGKKNIKSLEKFTAGSGSRRVKVYARKKKELGLDYVWLPDPAESNAMVLALKAGGRLSIETPSSAVKENPALSDIERLTFLSGKGERYDFLPEKLPDCIERILNRDFMQIRMVRSGKELQLYCKVSYELRVFSKYYCIAVDGSRREMAEKQNEILLYSFALQDAERLIRERNEALKKLLNARTEREQFCKKHKKALSAQQMNMKVFAKLPVETRREIRNAAKDPDTNWSDFQKDLDEQMKEMLREETFTENDRKKILAELKKFDQKVRKQKMLQLQQSQFAENIRKTEKTFRWKHQHMEKSLKGRAAVLYKKCRKILKHEFQLLDIERCFDISQKELENSIKIKIIRKVIP